MEIRRQLGLSMGEIRKKALYKYIIDYDFDAARKLERKHRRETIKYAVRKHGNKARSVLSQARIPINKSEIDFYEQLLIKEWKEKTHKKK